jgi:hypothetical protein
MLTLAESPAAVNADDAPEFHPVVDDVNRAFEEASWARELAALIAEDEAPSRVGRGCLLRAPKREG